MVKGTVPIPQTKQTRNRYAAFTQTTLRMNKRWTLILFLLTSSFIGICQVSITGIVIAKEDNLEIPGVRVTEKGTENETVTDMTGAFSIIVSSPDAILVFAFIGMVEKEVKLKGQNNIKVLMKSDCIKDLFDHQHIGLLANSGVLNNPIGGQFEFSFPAFFKSTTLKTALSYQTNTKENEFLNSEVELDHIIFECDYEMDLKWYYRQVSYDKDFKANVYSFESVLMFDFLNPIYIYSPGLIVGYGGLSYQEFGFSNKQVFNGPVLGLRAELGRLYGSEIYAKVGIFKDMIEYQSQFRFDYRKMAVFIKFYKLDSYTELSVGIGLNMTYKLKGQRK